MHYACLRNLVQEIEGKNCKNRGFASKMSFRKARGFSRVKDDSFSLSRSAEYICTSSFKTLHDIWQRNGHFMRKSRP